MSRWFATGLSPVFGDKPVYLMDTVSRPIRLSEGATRSRRVLIFDDHPVTTRLLDDVDPALQRKNKLALVEFGAVIVANARDVFAVVLTH